MSSIEHVLAPDLSAKETMDQILSQLDHYRHQSELLQKVNELYHRMAGVLDLPTMIETYSIWLAEHVPHELIGYNNQHRQRMHLFCSSHGPDRRYIIEIAEKILHSPVDSAFKTEHIDDLFSYEWTFESREGCGLLLLLHKDIPIPEDDINLINESLSILAEPLNRALDYEEIFEQARKDTLTGLPNRFVFEERIGCMIERANRYNHPLTLAALDLDHFKEVNDTMGHLMGDEVLQKVANTLKKQIRLTDLLVRMGGDEFLLILPDTDMEAAQNLGQRLCRAVEDLDIDVGQAKLGVSIGLSQWKSGISRTEWMEQADDILYQAKKNGRSQVAVH
jgi:diguanylate cyclase (GGDEF)-like protein